METYKLYRKYKNIEGKKYVMGDVVDLSGLRPATVRSLKAKKQVLREAIYNRRMGVVEDAKLEIPTKEIPPQTEVTEELVEKQEAKPESEVVQAEEEAYTKEYLEDLGMKELRDIGDKFDVKDNKKSDLVEKILEAQEA